MAKKKSYSNAAHDNDFVEDVVLQEEEADTNDENMTDEVSNDIIVNINDEMSNDIILKAPMPEIEEEPVIEPIVETIEEPHVEEPEVEVPIEKAATKQKNHYKVALKIADRIIGYKKGDQFYTLCGPFENLKVGDEFDY